MIASRSNHTHCQIAQKPTAQAKTCQRVCLPQRYKQNENKERKHNNMYSA